jgi:hypothetical protein
MAANGKDAANQHRCYTCYHWLPDVMKFRRKFPGVGENRRRSVGRFTRATPETRSGIISGIIRKRLRIERCSRTGLAVIS